MSITQETINTRVSVLQKQVSYNNVVSQSIETAKTLVESKQTEIGKTAGEILGGVQSLTSQSISVGQVNLDPTEGLISSAKDLVNTSLNTDINQLTSSIGVKISIDLSSFDSNGGEVSFTTIPSASGSIASQLAKMTGLGVEPGFLQNIISNASPKGIDNTLKGLNGKIGTFTTDQLNSLASRTQDVMSEVAANATFDVTNPNNSTAFSSFTDEVNKAVDDVSNVLKNPISISDKNITQRLKEIVKTDDLGAQDVLKSVKTFSRELTKFDEETKKFQTQLEGFTRDTKSGLMQGLMNTELSQNIQTSFAKIGVSLSQEQRAEVIRLAQGSPEELNRAIQIVTSNSKADVYEVRKLLETLDTTIAGTIVVDTTKSVFQNPFRIGTEGNQWRNNGVGALDYTFSFISSVEELEIEFKSIQREITEVVVHWTDTYSNANIGSEEINQTHFQLGLKGIGYHYVIRRDGSLQRGRPVNIQGQHAEINGHDKYSIGLAFVGGLNCSSETPNPTEYRSAQSLTRAQMNTFQEFCRAFYLEFPGGQILGHNDIDETEVDPGFDVIEYCKSVFGKKSVFTDPFNQGPFSKSQLLNRKPVQ